MGTARARIHRRQLAAVMLVAGMLTPLFNVLGGLLAQQRDRPRAVPRRPSRRTARHDALSSSRYFALLRRFVDDLSDPVLEADGEIYQYAGDEVVVTWRMETGVHAANCVRCFFGIHASVARETARYQRRSGGKATPVAAHSLRSVRDQSPAWS